MSLILTICFMALIGAGLYMIAGRVLCLPHKTTVSAIRHPHGKPSFDEQAAKTMRPITTLIAKLFPMSEYKRQRYEADFARLGIASTPQEYTAGLIAKSLMLAILGLAFILLGIPWLSIITCLAGLLSYFQSSQKLKKQVEKLNQAIDAELPRMVGTMECTLGDNRDLIGFFSRYRRVAGKVLGQELDMLLTDMQMGNQELALRRMEGRVQSSNLSALVMVLLGVDQGTDQRTSLAILSRDIRTKERELLRRRMEKRPGRIKTACFFLTIEMILMFMVPMVMMIIGTLSQVGF
ncbi:MAG: hypothetical protein RSD95_00735 [Clostridia bacterium]